MQKQKINIELVIKICPDPSCEAVWHNCPIKHTRCNDCGGSIKRINNETYWKKFSLNWFQYEFSTGEIFRPQEEAHKNLN